jgi:alkylation response protein AidB-like acyl-CoA dehydrogenase
MQPPMTTQQAITDATDRGGTLSERRAALQASIQAIADDFARDRAARQRRRELDPADFDRLRAAGFPLTAVPVEAGGLWDSLAGSARPVATVLRTLAHGDSSVALVSAMHPSILSPWLATTSVADGDAEWQAQRAWIFETVKQGHLWGTITSEPGSGGDPGKTRAVATRDPDGPTGWRLSGVKHFGSGMGILSYMITTAIPEGEGAPATYFVKMDGVPWDGTQGATLTAPWDGHGMTATQSHGMKYDNFPATRQAWRGTRDAISSPAGAFDNFVFTAVIVGIVEVAFETARASLARKASDLRAYERVEWSRAELDEWLILQAFEAMIQAMETKSRPNRDILMGKTAIAELAETALTRLSKVLGGGSFSRYSPFGYWNEDVRALGFLRPPWGFAFDRLFDGSLPQPGR